MCIETAEYYDNEVIYSNIYVNKRKLIKLFCELNWGSLRAWFSNYTYDDAECLISEMYHRGIPYKRVETGREENRL